MSFRLTFVAACIVAAVIAAGWWLLVRVPGPEPFVAESGPDEIDPQVAGDLLHRLNVGLGHLENDQLDDAIDGFAALSAEVPDELAAARNLMIARLLKLQKLEPNAPERSAAIDQAQAARDELSQLDPDSLATSVLAARLSVARDDTAAALEKLQRATTMAPEDLATWYEQYSLARYADDEELLSQAQAALDKAFALAPTNLVVLLERLQTQLEARDPAIVETLAAGEPRWEQLAPGIESRLRVDLDDLVEQATQAATDGDWPSARRNILIIKNVVTPEEATRSDRRQLERHALEFVLDTFSEPLMAAAETASNVDAAGPVPQFAVVPAEGALAEITSAQAIVSADFDLNRVRDLAVLQPDRVDILQHEADSWTPMLTYPIDVPVQDMIAIDLDDDVQPQTEATGNEQSLLCHSADLDLVLWSEAGVMALQNVETDSGRSLEPIELPVELADLQGVRAIVPGDFDMDGDLDLLVLTQSGLQLWGNLGDLQFDTSILPVAGVPEDLQFTAALVIDRDDDLDLDVILADASGRLSWLESLRHGEFQWNDLGIDTGMAVAAIEPLDRDGAWDLLIAGDAGLQRINATRPLEGRVELSEPRTLIEAPLLTMTVADLNNDGALDVVGLSPDGVVALSGHHDTSLSDVAEVLWSTDQSPECLDLADIDGNGRLDLFCGSASGAQLLTNETDTSAGWIDVSLRAEQVKGGDASASGRVNHYGIGSLLELRSGARRQRQIVRSPAVHFGLGESEQADIVRVQWTNGVPENVIEPAAQTFICERQTLKGSCPYLYGWNGEQFAFITDLLWAAPIGLVDPRGEIVPARPWENLLIRPDQLAPRNGKYELRLTEELWEAAYFDSVRLTAIDHPEGIEVVTNEKVGPPALAEHRLHTISRRQVPRSVIDQRGRDVRELIRERDERYVRLFDHKLRQGYTEPTSLELDLGDLSGAERITLFLTGWIYPTDTTINVALSQNARLDGPEPLSLSVPDKQGRWRTVLPFTGFPGGKTKTIAIDLSEAFLTDDYRVRLSTSQELYWDEIGFTVDEPRVELQQTELPLVRAELRMRGVSAAIEHPQHGPERYDYHNVLPSPWREMDGDFTRLGDVRELLTDDDSWLVVMGSGDEVVLEFEAPPPPPAGWARSFVLRNVGWDKDADLHTIYGQTVEPLPLRDMSGYPPPAGETPDDPAYKEYLRQYQTRQMR